MTEQINIRYIVSSLKDDLNYALEREMYEHCAVLRGLIDNFLKYIIEDVMYEDIEHDLFRICWGRYRIFRMINFDGNRFVVFIMPNYGLVYFYIDTIMQNSPLWESLCQDYEKQTSDIEKNIVNNFIEL